jgi:hypothetical protein
MEVIETTRVFVAEKRSVFDVVCQLKEDGCWFGELMRLKVDFAQDILQFNVMRVLTDAGLEKIRYDS